MPLLALGPQMIAPVLVWIFASWIIGLLGRHKRYGYFGNFLISFIFSPIVGLIVILASDDRRRR